MGREGYSVPPDYLSKELLAHRLDMKVGAIDQLVKRGILPPPVNIGEALRWRWPDVDRRIRGNGLQTTSADHGADDPYLKAINGAAPDADHQAATARPLRDGQGQALLLPTEEPRHRKSERTHSVPDDPRTPEWWDEYRD